MTSQISRPLIEAVREVVGPDPSEAELIRCLHMAKSDVISAVNIYFDMAQSSASSRDALRAMVQHSRVEQQGAAKSARPPPAAAPPRGSSSQAEPAPPHEPSTATSHESLVERAGPGPSPSERPLEMLASMGVGDGRNGSLASEAAEAEALAKPPPAKRWCISDRTIKPRGAAEGSSVRAAGTQVNPITVPDTAALQLIEAAPSTAKDGWWLLGERPVSCLSTSKWKKLATGQELEFEFPKYVQESLKGGNVDCGSMPSRSYWRPGSSRSGAMKESIIRLRIPGGSELGSLPQEWGRFLCPLASENKVRLEGTVLSAPPVLSIFDNFMVVVRVYANHDSLFSKLSRTTDRAAQALSESCATSPFTMLLRLLDMKPVKKAEFTPLDFQKKRTQIDQVVEVEEFQVTPMLPSTSKRVGRGRRAAQSYPAPSNSTQDASAAVEAEGAPEVTMSDEEVSKFVGISENLQLPEMANPRGLKSDLRGYQRQALKWMYDLEEGEDGGNSKKNAETLHPCWESYKLPHDGGSVFYHNVFSGETTLDFPSAMQRSRGGILADAMGLGKTVMTISLIVANNGRGGQLLRKEQEEEETLEVFEPISELESAVQGRIRDRVAREYEALEMVQTARDYDDRTFEVEEQVDYAVSLELNRREDERRYCEQAKKRAREPHEYANTSGKRAGGTLIVCPMTLLAQWKSECENHTQPGVLTSCIYYGCDRRSDVSMLWKHNVVITTYGTLQSEFKHLDENSPLQSVHWFRVVLDEAHCIKNRMSGCAAAAFALTADTRWCLTGTPIQNQLEDIFSLLCFLRVQPWDNWGWWWRLVQLPYQHGDMRSLKLLQALLQPLMLRRTKNTLDNLGKPILVLPPISMEVVKCQLSEEERDFYSALHERSKVKFDTFVAEGRVLHNYACILEMLLRLRQTCDHPFLVLSRGDNLDYADLNKLGKKFLANCPGAQKPSGDPGMSHNAALALAGSGLINKAGPTEAYVTELLERLRKGEGLECPICLESAEDAVLTPCAHSACRECLTNAWQGKSAGTCPVCRAPVTSQQLITVPRESRFSLDVNQNWKDSVKIKLLLEKLKAVEESGEKAIVFSQWTAFLDLLEIAFKKECIDYVRLDGTLSQVQREKALKKFRLPHSSTSVMLISLKAGGVGINLTTASHAFIMDPWWNPAVEEQAIMRIHRIGQTRPVKVTRFIVEDSVEERMQAVQARKQQLVNGALTNEEVRSTRIEELKMLFR